MLFNQNVDANFCTGGRWFRMPAVVPQRSCKTIDPWGFRALDPPPAWLLVSSMNIGCKCRARVIRIGVELGSFTLCWLSTIYVSAKWIILGFVKGPLFFVTKLTPFKRLSLLVNQGISKWAGPDADYAHLVGLRVRPFGPEWRPSSVYTMYGRKEQYHQKKKNFRHQIWVDYVVLD